MVKNFIFLFSLFPLFLFSGEFVANVDRNQVSLGDGFKLILTLKDAVANGTPSLDNLNSSFIINSQQQSSNAMIINGHVSTSTIWTVLLIPRKEGDAIIPSMTINTSEGILTTLPVPITTTKGRPATTNSSPSNDIALTMDVNTAQPYKNEPFFLTAKLISKLNLANIGIQKFNLDNAIIESIGQPKVDQQIMDGVIFNVVEFNYVITPLKGGLLKIPSLVVQGLSPVKKTSHFDDDFQSFFSFARIDQMKPFSVSTKEVELNVQLPIADINPWIPGKSLKIEEIWDDSQNLNVGEPFIRGFKIVAEGIMSSQLPSLSDMHASDHNFKVYADKPDMGEEIKGNNIKSFRTELYTLNPIKEGVLTLPEISIAWWDVKNAEKKIASVPARILTITPGLASKETVVLNEEEKLTQQYQQASPETPRDTLLYILVGGMAMLLIGALFWVILLQKQIGRLAEIPKDHTISPQPENKIQKKIVASVKTSPNKKIEQEKLPDLNPT